MNRRLQLLQNLPAEVKKLALSVFADEINLEIYKGNDIGGMAAGELTDIQTDILVKVLPINVLDKEVARILKIDSTAARGLAVEIAGKMFLIVDEWLGGAAANYLRSLGAAPETFYKFVENFKKRVEKDNADYEAQISEKPLEELVVEEEPAIPTVKLDSEPTTPEADKRDIKNVFQKEVVELLRGNDWQKKAGVNMLTIYYLGAEPAFRDELSRVLAGNVEKIGQKNIGEWLKIFVTNTEDGGKLNSIKKAQFFTSNKDVLEVPAGDRGLLDGLFDLYENLRNFFEDINKKPLEDVVIFPFTLVEREKIQADIKAFEQKSEHVVAPRFEGNKKERVIFSLSDEKVRSTISVEYDKKSEEFGDDKEKNLNYFEDALAGGDKVKILVGLRLLVEAKKLPEAILSSSTLQMVADGYAKRNGIAVETPRDGVLPARTLALFLRGVLEDRIGVAHGEAASFGAWSAGEFGAAGLLDYAQIAYFDEESGNYKWNL